MNGDHGDRKPQSLLRERLVRHRVALTLFLVAFAAGIYFRHLIEYDNTRVRLFTAISLVHRGTWNIDPWQHSSIDLSRGKEHIYSNKAIGLNLFVLPFHWTFARLTGIGGEQELTFAESVLLQAVGASLPHAVATLLLYLLTLHWSGSRRRGIFVALAYALGTIALQHATMFSGHGLTAMFLFASFYCAVHLRQRLPGNDRRTLLLALLTGNLIGWAVITEYPVVFIAIILTLYLLSLKPSWKVAGAWFLGGGIMALVLLWYNWAHFGSPFALSYGSLTLEEFAEETSVGLMGITWPRPSTFIQLTLLPARGLFAISPVLILAIPGAVALWRRRELRREWWVLVLSVLVVLTWVSGYFGWHSGWAYGSRYQLAILPFVALLLALSPRLGWLGWLLLGVSFAQNLLPVVGMPYPPEDIRNPLVECILPMMSDGYWSLNLGNFVGLTGWISLLPLLMCLATAIVLMLRWTATERADDPPAPALLPWRILAAGWLLAVAIMLTTIETERQTVHRVRARLLRDLFVNTGHEPFREAARRELLTAYPDFQPPP